MTAKTKRKKVLKLENIFNPVTFHLWMFYYIYFALLVWRINAGEYDDFIRKSMQFPCSHEALPDKNGSCVCILDRFFVWDGTKCVCTGRFCELYLRPNTELSRLNLGVDNYRNIEENGKKYSGGNGDNKKVDNSDIYDRYKNSLKTERFDTDGDKTNQPFKNYLPIVILGAILFHVLIFYLKYCRNRNSEALPTNNQEPAENRLSANRSSYLNLRRASNNDESAENGTLIASSVFRPIRSNTSNGADRLLSTFESIARTPSNNRPILSVADTVEDIAPPKYEEIPQTPPPSYDESTLYNKSFRKNST